MVLLFKQADGERQRQREVLIEAPSSIVTNMMRDKMKSTNAIATEIDEVM